MICAKFDGNLLRIFNVIVKKHSAYFLWTRCIWQQVQALYHGMLVQHVFISTGLMSQFDNLKQLTKFRSPLP